MDKENKKLAKLVEALDAIGYRIVSYGPSERRSRVSVLMIEESPQSS